MEIKGGVEIKPPLPRHISAENCSIYNGVHHFWLLEPHIMLQAKSKQKLPDSLQSEGGWKSNRRGGERQGGGGPQE